jgi:PASTA domain
VLDGGVENLVVEEGGRLWFEEDTGTLLFDHLVVLSRQRNDADLQVRLRSCPLGDHPQTRRLRNLVRGRDNLLHGLNRAIGECEQRAHLLPGWFRSEAGEASSVTPQVAGCGGQMDDVTGQTEADARSQLEAFEVEVTPLVVTEPPDDGLVLGQTPAGETMATPGATVTLTVGTLASTT